MRAAWTLAITISLGLAAGCSNGRADNAPAGAAAPINTAVGPIPGGGPPFAGRTNPFSGDRVALAEGRKLFNWYNCSGCHGGHAGGGMGPSLRDEDWIYGNRDDQIFDSIAHGRAHGMPTWGTKIPEQQIWKLVAYIKSMRTAAEPDPPLVPAHEEVPEPAIQQPGAAQ